MIALGCGDVLRALKALPDNSVHAFLSDPPYGIRFMGRKWDYDVPSEEVWAEALRVARPGAHLACFGGARTFHRVATRMEDAGWELRDCLTWLHAKGRPATTDKRLAPEGYNTALKPAWEPILLARKPLDGTLMETWERWGTGAMNIEPCRIGETGGTKRVQSTPGIPSNALEGGADGSLNGGHGEPIGAGRWPANLILGEGAAEMLDEHAGPRIANPYKYAPGASTMVRAALGDLAPTDGGTRERENTGASRFFFCPKVSRKERNAGCDAFPELTGGQATDREDGSAGVANARAGAGRTGGHRNGHPTLKPLALTTWLATLLLPRDPDAVLCVPYSGTGSEVIGGALANWPYIVSVEGDAHYCDLQRARLAEWCPGRGVSRETL